MKRSVRDKIAIPVDCALCPPWALPIIADFVRDGVLVHLDRAFVTEQRIYCDVYLLTPKGVALCEANGIPRQ